MLNIFKVQKGVAAEQRAGEGFFWAWCLFVRFVRLLFVVCQFVLCLCIRPSGKQNNRKPLVDRSRRVWRGCALNSTQNPKLKLENSYFECSKKCITSSYNTYQVPGTW